MFKTSIFTTLGVAAAIGLGAPAQAAAPTPDATVNGDQVTVRIPTTGLDLQSTAGAATLLEKIHDAAGFICGDAWVPDLQRYRLYRTCVRATVDRTVARLANPRLSELNAKPQRRVIAANMR